MNDERETDSGFLMLNTRSSCRPNFIEYQDPESSIDHD